MLIDGVPHSRMVNYTLKLPRTHSTTFSIFVGNTEELQCSMVLSTSFPSPIAIPIFRLIFMFSYSRVCNNIGCLVLEVLGPVITAYHSLKMQFHWKGKLVQLWGDHSLVPQHINLHQFKRLLTTDSIQLVIPLQVHPPLLLFLPLFNPWFRHFSLFF